MSLPMRRRLTPLPSFYAESTSLLVFNVENWVDHVSTCLLKEATDLEQRHIAFKLSHSKYKFHVRFTCFIEYCVCVIRLHQHGKHYMMVMDFKSGERRLFYELYRLVKSYIEYQAQRLERSLLQYPTTCTLREKIHWLQESIHCAMEERCTLNERMRNYTTLLWKASRFPDAMMFLNSWNNILWKMLDSADEEEARLGLLLLRLVLIHTNTNIQMEMAGLRFRLQNMTRNYMNTYFMDNAVALIVLWNKIHN